MPASELESERKRKISAGSPPPAEEEVLDLCQWLLRMQPRRGRKVRDLAAAMEVKIVCQFN